MGNKEKRPAYSRKGKPIVYVSVGEAGALAECPALEMHVAYPRPIKSGAKKSFETVVARRSWTLIKRSSLNNNKYSSDVLKLSQQITSSDYLAGNVKGIFKYRKA